MHIECTIVKNSSSKKSHSRRIVSSQNSTINSCLMTHYGVVSYKRFWANFTVIRHCLCLMYVFLWDWWQKFATYIAYVLHIAMKRTAAVKPNTLHTNSTHKIHIFLGLGRGYSHCSIMVRYIFLYQFILHNMTQLNFAM